MQTRVQPRRLTLENRTRARGGRCGANSRRSCRDNLRTCIELAAPCIKSRYRLGSFSQDPIGFAAGDANLYRYTGNQPTTRTDPSGLDWGDDYYDYAFGEDSWFVGLGNGIKGIGSALNPLTIPSDLKNAFAQWPNDVANAKRLWNDPSDYCADRYHIVSDGVAEQFSTPRGAGEAYVLIAGILVARKLPKGQGPMAQLEAKLAARTMTRAEWQAYSQMTRSMANGRVPVSRWGSPALRPEGWVMQGYQTPGNYACSFKWDFLSPTNKFAWPNSGSTYYVQPNQVMWPSGYGIDGRWKGLSGQRIYTGPETHVPIIVK